MSETFKAAPCEREWFRWFRERMDFRLTVGKRIVGIVLEGDQIGRPVHEGDRVPCRWIRASGLVERPTECAA